MKHKSIFEFKNFKRKFEEKKIIIATHNSGKLNELRNLLENINVTVYSSSEMSLPVPIENGNSFEENAYIKASETTSISGMASISDDSGLLIKSLGGSPGIYSADWAGPEKNFKKAIKKIEFLMLGKKDFSASMVCALCLTWPDGKFKIFKGEMKGEITFPPKGDLGFGYDPIFIPAIQPNKNSKLTYGQIEPEFKNKHSHRNIAFNKFYNDCFK